MPRPAKPPATRRRSRSEAFAKDLAKVLAKAFAKAKTSCGLLGGVLVNREFLAGSSRDPQDLDGFCSQKMKQTKQDNDDDHGDEPTRNILGSYWDTY